jgi:hypothetical protein
MSLRISSRTLGLLMAFGSGVLISAVSFELVQEAFDTSSWHGAVALGLLAGSVSFFRGGLVDRPLRRGRPEAFHGRTDDFRRRGASYR